MDAFELLKADHKKVSGLFDELEAASGKAKLSVFAQIKTELEQTAGDHPLVARRGRSATFGRRVDAGQ